MQFYNQVSFWISKKICGGISMSKIVETEVIDFDQSKLPVYEKKFPVNHQEAQDLKDMIYDYMDTLNQSAGNAALDLFEYLRDHTDYDVNLIWQNALRTMNLADLVKNLHLDFVMPSNITTPIPEGKRNAWLYAWGCRSIGVQENWSKLLIGRGLEIGLEYGELLTIVNNVVKYGTGDRA